MFVILIILFLWYNVMCVFTILSIFLTKKYIFKENLTENKIKLQDQFRKIHQKITKYFKIYYNKNHIQSLKQAIRPAKKQSSTPKKKHKPSRIKQKNFHALFQLLIAKSQPSRRRPDII